jgi:quinoprotein glucose dehydrogenase
VQPGGVAPLKSFLEQGSPREQQAVLQALATVGAKDKGAKAAEALVGEAFDRLAAGQLAPEAVLDLLEAAEAHKRGKVAEQLKAYEATRDPAASADPLARYRECLIGGDPRAGESIFRDRQDVSCIRCHSLHAQGGNAGPDLAGVSKRAPGPEYHSGREYILESILYPAKRIAPGFETITIRTTDSDDVIAGVLKGEDGAQVTLDVPNQGLVKVEKSKIKSRKGGMSAMPDDIAKTLSKWDLRDLVEYLAGQ